MHKTRILPMLFLFAPTLACSATDDQPGSRASLGGASGADAAATGGSSGKGGQAATGGQAGKGTGGGTSGSAGTGGAIASGGAAGTAGSSGAPGVWRPFDDSSPWNTPIAASPELDPDSVALIEDLATSCAQWAYLGINMTGYSIPVYYVDSTSTIKPSVTCTDVTGEGFDQPVPIPVEAAPDPESDHHLCIVDKQLRREWGMWNAVKQGDGSWVVGVGATSDLNGSGVRSPSGQASPWQMAHGARASGFPLIAGLIRVEEIQAGAIEHALILAYPHCRSRYFVPPASTAQGTTAQALPNRGIPMGGHVQLDPSVDVESLPLSASSKIIVRALQKYGAFVGDFSGAISLYAENAPTALTAWQGGLLDPYDISTVFKPDMLRKFRLLKMPALYDNNN